jgi:hypothetical protein
MTTMRGRRPDEPITPLDTLLTTPATVDRLKGQSAMTASTTSAETIQHISLSSPLSRTSRPTSARHVSTVINQPLAPVLAHLRSVTNGTAGRSAEADPTLEVVRRARMRQVCLRYTVYEVPGGTQVTASIESLGHGRFDPMPGLAVRAMRGRIATELSTMRDILE